MRALWQDLRFAARTCARQPGLIVVTLLTLGIGIGANSAIFSFFNAMILQPFPFEEPERLVRIWGVRQGQEGDLNNVIPRDLVYWQEQSKSFEGITGFGSGSLTLLGRGEPQRLQAPVTLPNFFTVLGTRAALGRTFLPEEGWESPNRVVVLSHAAWRRYFDSDPKIVSRSIVLDGEPYTVIGVAHESFEHPAPNPGGEPDLWRPFTLDPEDPLYTGQWLKAVGRLKPGVTLSQAQAEMHALSGRLQQQFPDTNLNWGTRIELLQDSIAREARPALLGLFAVVGIVLLIACANIASLLLARGLGRQRELAVRAAIGANRLQLIRQLLAESSLLALLGGALGLALAPLAIRLLMYLVPDNLPRLDAVGLNLSVLGFTLLVSLLTGLIFGLLPALRASRISFHAFLKEGTGGGVTADSQRLRRALVVFQIALSVMLLIAGALLGKSLLTLLDTDPGLQPDNVVTLEISLPEGDYPEAHQVRGFYERALGQLSVVPGVEKVGAVNALPFTSRFACLPFDLSGRPPSPPGQAVCADYRSVSKDYFQALGIQLRQGRLITERDNAQAQLVAVVNHTFAERFWPGETAIGKQLRWQGTDGGQERPWRTIVGVVDDVKQRGLGRPAAPEIYVSHSQDDPPPRSLMMVIRTTDDPLPLVPELRKAIWSVDRTLPVHNIATMEARIAESLWLQRVGLFTMSGLSAVALLLAAVGLYGIISYFVQQRLREFSIRMALGAERKNVLRLVVGQGLKLALIGVAVGLLGALSLGTLMAKILFGVSAYDPTVFLVVSVTLLIIAFLACYLPARRASLVQPVIGLRAE